MREKISVVPDALDTDNQVYTQRIHNESIT
jgi:hypothetical protein